MRVAVEKLPGVETVEVRLNDGLVTIRLAAGNRIASERIREVIRSNGFSPKAADVRVAGRLVHRDAAPALRVPGLDGVYLLVDASGMPAQTEELGAEVVVEGRLPEARDAPARRVMVHRILPRR